MLLAAAGFAAQAQVRVTDSLLPQIAADFHTTIGIAAMVVTAYAITHGSVQLVAGPVADRFGKYRNSRRDCRCACGGLRYRFVAPAIGACSPGDRRRCGLDHPDFDGLCRRCDAL
jgi:MFS family permease